MALDFSNKEQLQAHIGSNIIGVSDCSKVTAQSDGGAAPFYNFGGAGLDVSKSPALTPNGP